MLLIVDVDVERKDIYLYIEFSPETVSLLRPTTTPG
jgi:hypothetical protein